MIGGGAQGSFIATPVHANMPQKHYKQHYRAQGFLKITPVHQL